MIYCNSHQLVMIGTQRNHLLTLLNFWTFCWWTIPPHRKAHPSTSSIFDKTEPNNDCWTTLIIPFFNAYIEIIISVALPNVAFRRPPTASTKMHMIRVKTQCGILSVISISWRNWNSQNEKKNTVCPINEKMLVVLNQVNTTWIENSTCRSCKKSKLPAAGINEKQCQYLPK